MAPTMEYTRIENGNDDHPGEGLVRHDVENWSVDSGRASTKKSDDIAKPQYELLLQQRLTNSGSGDITPPDEYEAVSASVNRQERSFTTDHNTSNRLCERQILNEPPVSPSVVRKPVTSAGAFRPNSGVHSTDAARSRPSSLAVANHNPVQVRSISRNLSYKSHNVVVREVSKESSRSSIRSGQSKHLSGGSWVMEIVSFAIGLSSLAAMVGVLAHFDGRRMPNWPTGITLNTLIALLAAIANAAIATPLQQGLSQLKWITFQSESRPLTDMEHFDEASRGVLGSAKLLVLGRGGFLGSLGATVIILALAMGPMAQQIVGYQLHVDLAADDASRAPASINTALNYEMVLPGDNTNSNSFVPILPLKAAIYNGIFSADPNPSVTFTCPTGNCTWPDFSTLAVCSSCVDMSPYMLQVCTTDSNATSSNSTNCGWSLPNGASLNGSSVFSMTTQIPSVDGDMPYSTIMRLNFMGTEAQNLNTTTLFTGSGVSNPWARQCSLQYCVQDLHTYIQSGNLTQTITGSHFNNSVVSIREALNNSINTPLEIASPTNNQTYVVGMGPLLGIQQYFSGLFRNGTATRQSTSMLTRTENSIIVNLTVGISSGETFFDTDVVQAFYWFYYEYPTGLDMLIGELAATMTNAFRESPGNGTLAIKGQSFEVASFVHIRWGWITLPAIVVAMTGVFLGLAMMRSRSTRTKLWKSSAIAMLFHGLDGKARAEAMRSGSLREIKVRLDDEGLGKEGEVGEEGGRLLRTA